MTSHTTEPADHGPLVSRLPMIVPLTIYVVTLALFFTDDHSRHGFPLDDAWIHRVYAESFASGLGFQYNPGSQEAGLTSPAWAILTAPAHWFASLGENAVATGVKTIGAIFGGFAILAVSCAVRHLTGSLVAATVAASLFAIDPRLHFNAISGMETILLIACWAAMTSALVRRRLTLAAIIMGIAPTVRPEAVLIVPFFLLALWFGTDARRHGLEFRLRLAAYAVAPSLAWGLYCRSVTGHWLPTTFYMKSTGFQLGGAQFEAFGAALVQSGLGATLLLAVGLVVWVVWVVLSKDRRAWIGGLLWVAAPVVFALGVVGSRGFRLEGFYWTRWTDPAALLLTAAAAGGVSLVVWGLRDAAAVLPHVEDRFRVTTGVRVAAGVTALALVFSVTPFAEGFVERRARFASDSRAIDVVNVQAGKWVAANVPESAVVGVNDAGAIRYFGGRKTIDLVGLNHAPIAFQRKSLAQALAETDWLVIFPSWFAARGALEHIDAEFALRELIEIPLVEYTICECPGQTQNAILQRRAR